MNAGGAATAAGMDFQSRIAAVVLAHMLTNMRGLNILGLEGEQTIESMGCETTNAIDDLRITTTDGLIFVQAKRTISLSDRPESDFSSVIKQFAQQYLQRSAGSEVYVLATTSDASSRITRELRKMTEAARLDKSWKWEGVLNSSELNTLSITRTLIKRHLEELNTKVATDAQIREIFESILIGVVDIELNSLQEKALLVLLSEKSNIRPDLLWSALIALAAHLAANRLTIDSAGLLARLGRYTDEIAEDAQRRRRAILNVELKGQLSSGRELVLAEMPTEIAEATNNHGAISIMEFYRFDGAGAKRLRFADGYAYLANDVSTKVICRASSYQGVERYLSNHEAVIKDKRVVFMPIKGDEDYDATTYAKAYGERCEKLYFENENDLNCLHCGDPISESNALLVEIDEENHPNLVGNVHERCLQPLYRILGRMQAEVFDDHTLLRDFDYRAWFGAMQSGRALFAGMHPGMNQVAIIGWNPRYSAFSRGEWCVKINLEDGSSRYVHERGRVPRESRAEAETTAAALNEGFAAQKKKNDPYTYTSLRESFAPFSINLSTKLPEESCITCVNAEVVRFSRAIDKAYSRFSSFYTPLLYLVDLQTGGPLVFLGSIFLLSDPLKLADYHRNWKQVWPEFPEFRVSAILADPEFDKFVGGQLASKIQLAIDPLFDLNGEIVRGHSVVNYEDMLARGRGSNRPPET
jgi:hypothetical protein